MKKHIIIQTNIIKQVVLIVLCVFISVTLFSQNKKSYYDNVVIVKLKSDFVDNCRNVNDINKEFVNVFSKKSSFDIKQEFANSIKPRTRYNKYGVENVDISNIYRISYSGDESLKLIVDKINKLKIIEYVEPLYIHDLLYVPNDPLNQNSQYWIEKVKAFEAWDIHKGDTNVVIGVSDTGFDLNHPDLIGNIKYNYNDPIDGIDNDGDGYVDNYAGWNFGENNNDAQSVNNPHGTYVSGISSGVCDNGIGVSGAGFNCKFLPIKCYNESKKVLENVFQTIVYAADQGCKIVNCSWGGDNYQKMGQDVIDYATINKDMLVVAAAGNTKSDLNFYPASYRNVLSVGGTNELDEKSSISTYSYRVDVSAPSCSFHSTDNNGTYTKLWSGTSYAAPIVSGLAGILRSCFPNFNALQIKELIKISADNIDHIPNNVPYANKLGSGRVNFYKALTMKHTPSVVFDMKKCLLQNGKIKLNGVFTNYLAKAENLSVSFESLSEYASIVENGDISIGNLGTLSKYTPTGDIVIDLSEETPVDYLLTVKISYLADGYEANQFVEILVNEGYVNISTDFLILSIASNGRFGYDDLESRIGDGYMLNSFFELFDNCGIIAGSSPEKIYSSVGQSSDFKTIVTPHIVNEGKADNHVRTIFDDSYDSLPMGLRYIQNAYSWNGPENKNFIIVDYAIINDSPNKIDDFYFGIYTDWDLYEPVNNSCHYSVSDNFMYAKSEDSKELFSGIKVLSNHPVKNYSYINTSSGDGSINIRDGFSDLEKFTMISNSVVVSPDIAFDVILYSGVGPISIAANDTAFLSFAFVSTESYSEMSNAIETSAAKFNSLHPSSSKNKIKSDIEDVSIFPNPTTDYIMILSNLPCSQGVDIFIYDEQGSKVYQELDFNNKEINLKHLSQGIYIITIGCEGVLEKKKVLKLD